MLELLASVICSEDEPSLLARVDRRFDPQTIWDVEQVLRDIANQMSIIETGRVLADKRAGEPSPMRSMLRLENAFDRMAGFDPNVRRVVAAVFSKMDERARHQLGFALSDSLAFASLYNQVRMQHADQASRAVAKFEIPEVFVDDREEVAWNAAHLTLWALHAGPKLEGGEQDRELARRLGLGRAQFAALVGAMGTKVGTVEPETALANTSTRTKPLILLSSGEWMWARPIDFLHGALEWALDVCRADQKLLQCFDSARQSVAEELTADIFEEVFGSEYVFRNVRYADSQSDAESDVIVALPGVSFLIEAKGGRFSAPGRRAAPLRVERHAKELVAAGAGQNRRTAMAVAHGKTLTDRAGRSVPTEPTDDLVPLVVTLDRIDPFSTFLGRPEGAGLEERNWVVSLTDLVMIAEILPTPEEFLGYAGQRIRMVRDDVRVFVEADCLGHWCADRTAGVHEITGPYGDSVRLISETSQTMNDYFTQITLAEIDPESLDEQPRFDKPATGIPSQILAALARERATHSRHWWALVDAVAQVAPEKWKPLQRLLERIGQGDPKVATRQDRKRVRKLLGGWTIDERVVVTLISPETSTLRLSSATNPVNQQG